MLERFPLSQALEKVLKGSGQCAEADWTFLGASIAEWSLLWFVALAAWSLLCKRSPQIVFLVWIFFLHEMRKFDFYY